MLSVSQGERNLNALFAQNNSAFCEKANDSQRCKWSKMRSWGYLHKVQTDAEGEWMTTVNNR